MNYDQTTVCDDGQNIDTTSTACIVTFQLDTVVTTTAGDLMMMQMDTLRPNILVGNYGHFYGAVGPRDGTWVASRVHLLNSGAGNTLNWDDAGGNYASHQFVWAWNFATSSEPEPCTENCNSNILFLPGTMGSRLYSATGTKHWEPGIDPFGSHSDLDNLALDITGTSTRPDIYTDSVLDEFEIFGVGTTDIYKSFLEDLEDWKNEEEIIEDYAAVPYDWRLSLEDIVTRGNRLPNGHIYYSGDYRATSTTPYLIDQLQSLASSSRTGKVTIVAHSYGGLVAKALMKYLQDHNDPLLSKIDNLVLVAVPQTGTPKAIASALHGYGLGIPDDWASMYSAEAARSFASTTPMLYSLLPSENYFTDSGAGSYVSTTPVTFAAGTGTQSFLDTYGPTIDGTAELYNFLLGYDERDQPAFDDLIDPSILHSNLIADAESVHFGLDLWTAPTSTNVYQIAGWGMDTVGRIDYEAVIVEDFLVKIITPYMVIDGDDTVVIPSALAMSTSTSNVKRLWLNLRDYDTWFTLGRAHSDIFEIPQLRNLIRNNILTNSTSSLPEFITSNQPISDPGDERLQFFLHSPLVLSVKDASGHEVGPVTSTLKGGIYRRLGEMQYISVPVESQPIVELKGYDSGRFTLDVKQVRGNQILAKTRFLAIPTTTTTRAFMEFPDGSIKNASSLKIDMNSDGFFEKNLMPKLNDKVHDEVDVHERE